LIELPKNLEKRYDEEKKGGRAGDLWFQEDLGVIGLVNNSRGAAPRLIFKI
jgi:hypothetical protein